MSLHDSQADLADIRSLLTRYDPAPAGEPVDAGLLARVHRRVSDAPGDRAAVVARRAGLHSRRRLLVRLTAVASAATVAAAIALGVGVHPQTASATPALPKPLPFTHGTRGAAVAVLQRAARLQRSTPTAGSVRYGKAQEYALQVDVGRRHTTTVVATTVREVWVAPNGSALVREYAQNTEPTGGDIGVPRALHNLDHSGRYPPGGWADPALGLPTDPAAAQAAMLHQIADPGVFSLDIELGDQIASALSSGTTTPQQNAALYQVLAGLPGVFDAGVVHDQAGRTGHAVGIVTSGPGSTVTGTSYLVIDAATGRPLQTETVDTPNPPPALRLPPGPTVEDYHLIENSGQTTRLGGP